MIEYLPISVSPLVISPDGKPLRKAKEGDVIQIEIEGSSAGRYRVVSIDPDEGYTIGLEPVDA